MLRVVSTCTDDVAVLNSGADVGHPSPGVRNRPSVTGLVASVGPGPNFMTSMTRIQQPRVEIIQDLEEMISVGLDHL